MLALDPPVEDRPFRVSPSRPQLLEAEELGYLLAGFRGSIDVDERTNPNLRAMLEEMSQHPGSLVRAQLAFRLFRGSPIGPPLARDIAIAIEYFHTASLILDDLPMMDDARRRRGRPCPHLQFGEATALLGALALINQAYALAWGVMRGLPRPRAERASRLLTELLGVRGLLDGQSQDLSFGGAAPSPDRIIAVAERKTVPLIRMSLVLPGVLLGMAESSIDWLDRLASVWGLAYQQVDDLKDCLDSDLTAGKSTRRDLSLGRPNLCNHLGTIDALARLRELLAEAEELFEREPHPDWAHLRTLQTILETEVRKIEARSGAGAATGPVSLASRCRTAI